MTGQLFSPVDGAPVPDTAGVDVAHLQRRNRELLAQVEALTTALHAADTTIETLRADSEPPQTTECPAGAVTAHHATPPSHPYRDDGAYWVGNGS